MKNKYFGLTMAVVLAAAAANWWALTAIAADTFPQNPAKAVVGGDTSSPNTWTNIAVPATQSSGSTSNVVSQPVTIVPGYDYGIEVDFTGGGIAGTASASSSTVTVKGNFTTDGTNWQTVIPFTFVTPLTQTNSTVIASTNIASVYISSFKQIRIDSVATTDTNTLTWNHLYLTRAKKPFVN